MNEQTIKVWFTDSEEFLEELGKEPPNISKVIRLTKTFKHSDKLPLQSVSVVATFLRHQWLSESVAIIERVELKCPCGQIHDYSDEDELTKRVMNRAEEIQDKIEKTAKSLQIDVRAGIYDK
jgi:hypothetical protein